MTATSHADVARRLLANVDAGTSDQAEQPDEGPDRHLPRPERWETEMEQVFRRSPLVVALSCDIRNPGDYDTLEIADRPILVVRGDDGVARTFLNVCRHRGAQVAEGCGHTRRFTCPYHAWVYDTRGKIVGVPGRNTFGELDVSALVELPTHERAGLVLAVLTPDLDFDPDEWLAGMGDAAGDASPRRAPPLPGGDGARQPELEAHRRRLRRRLPPRLPPQLDHRREVDHQPQHLRLLRAARAHRLRQQADQRDPRPAGGGVAADVRGDEHGPLRLPEHVDLRPAGATADGEPAAPRPDPGPLAHAAVPLLPPAGRG